MTPTEEYRARYMAAARRMQSGVAVEVGQGEGAATPKHLRVGLNSALVSHGALVRLLVDQGLIAEEDWFRALAETMEAEVAAYEARLSARLGRRVTLGEAGFGAEPERTPR